MRGAACEPGVERRLILSREWPGFSSHPPEDGGIVGVRARGVAFVFCDSDERPALDVRQRKDADI